MAPRWILAAIWTVLCVHLGAANKLPVFTQDMDNLALSESTPVGEVVYTLLGMTDPEGLHIKYGLVGTDKFAVNADTGEVTLIQPLDREKEDTIKFLVEIQNQDPETGNSLVQSQPATVIVLDENDNPPIFKHSPYEVDVPEDEKVGTTILQNIEVEDQDSVGDNLEVGCVPNDQWPEACKYFEVVGLQSTANRYSGALVLRRRLDYDDSQFYQFHIYATDGIQNSTAAVEVKVLDVQNRPPVFSGPLSAALAEDVPAGSTVLAVLARDPDRAQPRPVRLELLTNPHNFFWLDSASGELKTAKPLDREALADPSSPLNLTIRATEIVNGAPLMSNLTSSLATVTITIKDVNDEPPRFNRREYSVEIPESLPLGTPLPNLDMVVTDTDVGANSVFGLRLADDSGAFVVEPAVATGKATVTIRLNSTLDYEDPNQRKFILEVIAEELRTAPRLRSRASVTVSLADVNDNAPRFADEPYAAAVPEAAPPGARLAAPRAADRDSGRFGTEGIIYELSGHGAELFSVDNRTGVITVAPCPTPGTPPCMDYETRKDYYLQYKATDDFGRGQSSVAPLQVSLSDSNDNAPQFVTPVFKASIDEDAVKFEPELQVQARDADATSDIRYSIVSPESQPFWIDPATGRISVKPDAGGVRSDDGRIVLTVLATDGVYNATAKVEITVRDVNNHAPQFDMDQYDASVTEDAPLGSEVAAVRASDRDRGANARLRYGVQQGALDAFSVDPATGVVTVAAPLDHDRRAAYRILITAADMGIPSLTGTTELVVHIINVNDKKPYFTPSTQRAEVSADADPGTELHTLVAVDPDVTDPRLLKYELATDKPIKAVDKNLKEISDDIFGEWFAVHKNGSVTVSRHLDRERATVVTLPVTVTDASAPTLQTADGELIINIVDVNRHAPVFGQPAYTAELPEELPVGSVLDTFTASDRESALAAILIRPPSPYFQIDNVTGVVKSIQRIDYEKVHSINFTLVAIDSGVPQRSSSAAVTVAVRNINDEEPAFERALYEAELDEHAPPGTPVLTVHATDDDEDEFGEVSYSLSGPQAALFTVDPASGALAVAAGAELDRERAPELRLRAVATDRAPPQLAKASSVPIHIKLRDINDNSPIFTQKVYKSTITENLKLDPPATILQVLAEDKDEGINGEVRYSIVEQSEPGLFTVDPVSGIIYPARAAAGGAGYWLRVEARDGAGRGPRADRARVDVAVLRVNTHSPVYTRPPPDTRRLEVPEHAAQADYLVTTIQATDEDEGENGRVSYYLKLDNENVNETPEFSLHPQSGELRIRTFLDRELHPEYQLVVAAADHGAPARFESLRLLTVALVDDRDTPPAFPAPPPPFAVRENLPPGVIVGTVKAIDKDTGDNGKVYYHILDGNEEGAFTLDRTQGILRANMTFDREKQDEYTLTISASNRPEPGPRPGPEPGPEPAQVTVRVRVLDDNDNEPVFRHAVYYAGIKHTARVNEPIISVVAEDPDLAENGTLMYVVAASNLYKFGSAQSSGSVVPSPFNISQDGVVSTAAAMAEYARDRFVLELRAQELAAPHRHARATLHIWIIDRSALIRMVVSRSCAAPVDGVTRALAAAGRALLVAGRRRPLVQADTRHDDWCEIHMHAVDPMSYQVLSVDKVLGTIDSKYDDLKDVYQEFGVETLIAASATSKAVDSFDPALAALIALLIVLFTGIVTFVVVCACLKHWVIPPPSLQSSKGDSLARRRILEELSTTDNPLWLDTKLRPYEEQELSMAVFGDPEPPADSEHALHNTLNTLSTDTYNTYATIAGGTMRGREEGALAAGLGFQGSTFKPPSADTPEPPPRPSGLAQLLAW